jgi:hypothetical protein
MNQKDIFELAITARKINTKFKLIGEWSKINLSGIVWAGDKETGKLYHAYCEFELRNGFSHPLKNDGFFEDCIQTSKEANAIEARKKGWLIGKGKFKEFAICPLCVEKMKQSTFEEINQLINAE